MKLTVSFNFARIITSWHLIVGISVQNKAEHELAQHLIMLETEKNNNAQLVVKLNETTHQVSER